MTGIFRIAAAFFPVYGNFGDGNINYILEWKRISTKEQMMKHFTMTIVVFCLILPLSLQAQIGIKFRGSGGWCVGDRYEQTFVNSNLETVNGQVMSVDTVTPFPQMSSGIKMVLKTDREDVTVHLGPAWFILYQGRSLSVNQKNVEVRGCRAVINGKPVIMASTVVSMGWVLKLRDDDGIPYWCGWREKF